MPDRSKPPKGLLITGLVLLVLSIGSCGFGGVSIAGFIGDLADIVEGTNSTPLGTPSQLSANGEAAVILTSNASATCEVRDSAGNSVTLDEPGAGATGTVETTDGATLDFAYSFDTTSSETYDVLCGDEISGGTGEYVVVPFPGFGKLASFLGGFAAGVVLFVLGVIFLIVGLVKRSKWKKNNAAGTYSGPPPGGGYAPQAPGQPQGGYAPPPGGGYTPPAPGQAPPPMPPQPQAPPAQTPPPMPPGPPPGNTPPPPGNTPPPFGS